MAERIRTKQFIRRRIRGILRRMNQLYYGDNLQVLREHVREESVDLVYLDPPFNSRQDYNVLFAEKDGTQSASQIMAFEDTWEWNLEALLFDNFWCGEWSPWRVFGPRLRLSP